MLYVHEHEIKEEFDCQQSDSRTMSADKGCCVVEHVERGCDRLARRDVHWVGQYQSVIADKRGRRSDERPCRLSAGV